MRNLKFFDEEIKLKSTNLNFAQNRFLITMIHKFKIYSKNCWSLPYTEERSDEYRILCTSIHPLQVVSHKFYIVILV